MKSLAPCGAAAAIAALDAPVLYMDACSLLDILRAPMRRSPLLASTAVSLTRAVSGPAPAAVLVMTEVAHAEYMRHRSAVSADVIRDLQEMEIRSDQYAEVESHLSGTPPPAGSARSLEWAGGGPLLGLADALAEASLKIGESFPEVARASRRALDRTPPWNKGEYADCHIIEHVLAVARLVHKANPARIQVFVSSNIADYGAPGRLRFPLPSEFESAGLQFALDLSHAKSIAGV